MHFRFDSVIYDIHTGVLFGDENTPCPNDLKRLKSIQKYASISDDKKAELNAKRRENYHHKKAERLAASGINVINFFYGNVQKMI
jgi:hypothetical protein